MNETTQSSDRFRPPGRLWMPVTLLVLAVVTLTIVQSQPELERNYKSWITATTIGAFVILNLIWFFFFSKLSGFVKTTVGSLLFVLAIGVKEATRIDGTLDGRGIPKLAWKWSTKPPATRTAPASSNNPVSQGGRLPVRPKGAADVPHIFARQNESESSKLAQSLARDWTKSPPTQLWRKSIGAGWSAFAIIEGAAFTQEQQGELEVVSCYELATGNLIWSHSDTARFFQWQGGEGPRATPTLVDGLLYSYGATGILNCLDATSGRLLWTRNVLVENKLSNLIWGVSGSPLVEGNLVIVSGGSSGGPSLLAYDRKTGKPLWTSGNDKASYATPMAATLAGKRTILSVNAASLTIHETETGKVLLDYSWPPENWPKASQPLVLEGDRIFISAGYGVGCTMLKVTANNVGQFSAETLWKNKMMKTQFNSAAFFKGRIYGLDDGMLACVDAADGKRLWKDGRYASGQSVLIDDLIFIQAESGFIACAEAKPEGFREFGRIPALDSKTWNYPTIAGRFLIVRNDREMVCYQLPLNSAN